MLLQHPLKELSPPKSHFTIFWIKQFQNIPYTTSFSFGSRSIINNLCSHKTYCINWDLLTLCTTMLKKNKPFFWDYPTMETATLIVVSISCLLVSFTDYALNTIFKQPSNKLKDIFEEHKNYLTLNKTCLSNTPQSFLWWRNKKVYFINNHLIK